MGQTLINSQIKTTNQALMKEDVADIIYNLSPTDTPFMSSCKRGSTKNTKFSWNLDTLADAAIPNGIPEGEVAIDTGDGTGNLPISSTKKVAQEPNYTQIFRKICEVSSTTEAVELYGRKSEMAYQMAKKSQEIKRDIEKTLLNLSNTAVGIVLPGAGTPVANEADPRVTRNFANILDTNKLVDAGNIAGTSTCYDAARTELSTVTMDGIMQRMWNLGAKFDFILPTPAAMEKIATFALGGAGLSGRFRDSGQGKKLVNVVDVYVSPYGDVSMVLDKFLPPANTLTDDGAAVNGGNGNLMFFVDPGQLELKYLRSFSTVNLAKVGDAEKKMIIAELGLCVKAPHGCGVLSNFSINHT